MGSDGVMQALIRGWDVFSLQFNLAGLNCINVYILACARNTDVV